MAYGWRSIFTFATVLFSIVLSQLVHAQEKPFSVNVKAEIFSNFEPSKPSKKTFGPLTFKSGAALLGDQRAFGGLSGLQIVNQGRRLIAISDSGYWLTAKIERDADQQFQALKNVKMIKIYSGAGPRGAVDKYFRDAEGLARFNNQLYVSFEGAHTISEYGYTKTGLLLNPRVLKLPEDLTKTQINKGMEALAHAPRGTTLEGHLVAILERGGRRQHPTYGWIINPERTSDKTGRFTLLRDNLFDITGAEFLKNGDLIVLERRFTLATGAGMRLRLIKADELKKDATITGKVVFEAGLPHRIDNMESVSIYENEAGETILALISDDNHSVLQRTILLEFVLDAKKL